MGVTPVTAGSKPAYIRLSSSLIRRLGLADGFLYAPLFLHTEDPLYPYAGTSLSKSTETGQDLWLVCLHFPKSQYSTRINPAVSAEALSHRLGLVSAQTIPAGTCRSIDTSHVSLLPLAL